MLRDSVTRFFFEIFLIMLVSSSSTVPTNVRRWHKRVTGVQSTVPEIIGPVFAKTSQNARFLLSENERFGLVFVKTGTINSGTVAEFMDPLREI